MIAIFPPFMSYRYCEHELCYKRLNSNDTELLVFGFDGIRPNLFNAIDLSQIKDFHDINEKINNDGMQMNIVYRALEKEVVLAKVGDQWCRCKFLGQCGSDARVYDLDHGTIYLVSMQNIRVRTENI